MVVENCCWHYKSSIAAFRLPKELKVLSLTESILHNPINTNYGMVGETNKVKQSRNSCRISKWILYIKTERRIETKNISNNYEREKGISLIMTNNLPADSRSDIECILKPSMA